MCENSLMFQIPDLTVSIPALVYITEGVGTVQDLVCATLSGNTAVPVNITLVTSDSTNGKNCDQ